MLLLMEPIHLLLVIKLTRQHPVVTQHPLAQKVRSMVFQHGFSSEPEVGGANSTALGTSAATNQQNAIAIGTLLCQCQ